MNLSVVIPAYQCKASLSNTVARITQCPLPLAEILLIDDGSTDGTAALCDRLAEESPLIRCVHKKNGGVSSARNLGIELARGDYIWFVDADDEIRPIPKELLPDCTDDSPGMVLFGMQFDYYRGARLLKTEICRMPERLRLTAAQYGTHFSSLFRSNYLSPVWNKLFRRSLLVEQGLRFDPALTNYEDLAFSLQVLSRCESVDVLPEVCYIYKTDYDHDRTVDRIGRIDNAAANTDIIAAAFLELSSRCGFDPESSLKLKRIVLQIYLEIFRVKMQTTPLRKVRGQCEAFSASPYYRLCLEAAPPLSPSAKKLTEQIQRAKAFPIWLRIRRKMLRSRAAKIIKPLMKRA